MSVKSRPRPGSTGEVLRELPSPYEADRTFGLLHLPRFIAKIRYVKQHGALPASYRKNYKRGFDRFLCLHLGVDPGAVEKAVLEAADDTDLAEKLKAIFPEQPDSATWNRTIVQKGMTEAGREFLTEALEEMGCRDRIGEIKSVADLIDFDEGKIV